MQAEQSEMLAGKYRDASELEKAYLELEKKLGSGSNASTENEEVYEEANEESDYGVDFLSAVNQELEANGELSEETLALFDDLSSRDLFEAMQRYDQQTDRSRSEPVEMSDQEINQIQNMVGGVNNYDQLTAWAADNMSAEEIEAYDSLVDSGNTAAIKLALQALQYRYQDANGYEGEMLTGKPAQSSSGFRSQAELVRAMSDPRYDNDEAYRDDVMRRLSISDLNF
jgi:hypothetical protein